MTNNPKIIAFCGYKSPYSNFHPSLFLFENLGNLNTVQAVSVEYAFVYLKLFLLKPDLLPKLGELIRIKYKKIVDIFLSDPDNFDVNKYPEWNNLQKEIKQLGRSFKANPNLLKSWDNIKVQVMEKLLFQKFRQNKKLKEELLSNQSALYYEMAEWDSFWGTGINSNAIKDLIDSEGYVTDLNALNSRLKGENKLGQLILKVKDLILFWDKQYEKLKS